MTSETRTKETVNIRISVVAWKRLTALKLTPGDDFDTVVLRLLDMADAFGRDLTEECKHNAERREVKS